ncbi:hypothetical protein C8A05DRAFT_33516 [Staphylotrichum tortipilum]|uniref:Uncharacterized protein n=1 Tax=Staphylotrichum tortipilum TaxID=2831512 RepID=A0AAN6RU23_9PEZI|nr:hypothetical protein C8A05DRAFT_33516 [Staphylotrichum longicolle]
MTATQQEFTQDEVKTVFKHILETWGYNKQLIDVEDFESRLSWNPDNFAFAIDHALRLGLVEPICRLLDRSRCELCGEELSDGVKVRIVNFVQAGEPVGGASEPGGPGATALQAFLNIVINRTMLANMPFRLARDGVIDFKRSEPVHGGRYELHVRKIKTVFERDLAVYEAKMEPLTHLFRVLDGQHLTRHLGGSSYHTLRLLAGQERKKRERW